MHLLESRGRSEESLWKVDLLQQMLLVLAQKYPALATKLAWSLLASIADYVDFKRIYQVIVFFLLIRVSKSPHDSDSICGLLMLAAAIRAYDNRSRLFNSGYSDL